MCFTYNITDLIIEFELRSLTHHPQDHAHHALRAYNVMHG